MAVVTAIAQPKWEELVAADVVARYLKCSPKTMAEMARRGEIPAVSIRKGGRKNLWRFRMSDIIEHFEAKTQRPST